MYWRCRVMLCTRQVILLRWPPPPPPNNKTCPWVSFNKTLSRWRHPAQPSFYFISHSNQYWNVELFARKKILILQFTLSGERFVFFISFYKINYLKRPQRNWIISREKRENFFWLFWGHLSAQPNTLTAPDPRSNTRITNVCQISAKKVLPLLATRLSRKTFCS